uniref:Uncharacterized protein n=1 Tax=Nelumbo nucifera TaxID=4432 RepID=A0A822Y219_NELNU|nr:TPA_asm: hypothetical protein HUJ06_026569 [Nelumbo nucifera]
MTKEKEAKESFSLSLPAEPITEER